MQPEPTPTGVIHNIGYRGYEGARLGRRGIARSLFVHSLRGVFGLGRSGRSKVLPAAMFTIMVLPALIIAVVTVTTAGQGLTRSLPLDYSHYPMVLQAAVAIFVAAQAPQTVSLDLRFHTLPLYMSRPLERIDYVVAKYAAFTVAVFILLATPLLILYAGALLAELPFGEQTGDFAPALAGAVLYALVLSGISLAIASLTARRGLGIAAIITVLMMTYTVTVILQGIIGHGQGDMATAGWLGLFSPMMLVDGVQVWAFGADPATPAGPPNNVAGMVFSLVTIAVITGSYAFLARRYEGVRL